MLKYIFMENFSLIEFCPSLYSLNLAHTHTDNSSHDDSQTISLLIGKKGRITIRLNSTMDQTNQSPNNINLK